MSTRVPSHSVQRDGNRSTLVGLQMKPVLRFVEHLSFPSSSVQPTVTSVTARVCITVTHLSWQKCTNWSFGDDFLFLYYNYSIDLVAQISAIK